MQVFTCHRFFPKKGICKFAIVNKCFRGKKCRWSHQIPEILKKDITFVKRITNSSTTDNANYSNKNHRPFNTLKEDFIESTNVPNHPFLEEMRQLHLNTTQMFQQMKEMISNLINHNHAPLSLPNQLPPPLPLPLPHHFRPLLIFNPMQLTRD